MRRSSRLQEALEKEKEKSMSNLMNLHGLLWHMIRDEEDLDETFEAFEQRALDAFAAKATSSNEASLNRGKRAAAATSPGAMSDAMGKAVWQAAEAGKEPELKRLIGLGGNVNWHNPADKGGTALMEASRGHEGCVELLLEAQANVNDTEDDGWAAIHWAAQGGHLAIVKRLLQGGADPSLRDEDGRTALDVARNFGENEIVALLSEPRCARPPPKKSERPAEEVVPASVKRSKRADGARAAHVAERKRRGAD